MDKNKEKNVISCMVAIYCQGHHNSRKELCENCLELMKYIDNRLDKCPFGNKKTFCSNCSLHCYNKEMMVKVKDVMRYSGPRMILYHPVVAFQHCYQSYKSHRKIKE